MLNLKPFRIEDWVHLQKWISNESELIQFAGQVFTFPIDQKQIETYLSDKKRLVFRVENNQHSPIGIAEIYLVKESVAKLARILIGEKPMRGKGLGTELINILVDYGFNVLNKEKIVLNVFSWNTAAIKCYANVGFIKSNKPIEVVKIENEEWEIIEMIKIPS